jgi:hypothetical protein
MSSTSLKLAMAWSLAATLAAACGSVDVDKKASSNASGSATGAGGAGTSSSTGGDVGGGIGFGGAPGTSSSTVSAGGSPAMPGTFDCNGCLCDGATHFCEQVFHDPSPPPPPGPPPEPLCADDAGLSGCKPIPAACLPTATCQCVDPQLGSCVCKVDHAGITVTCTLP